MKTALEVGKELVELCKGGKFLQAVETLYAQNVVSIEAGGGSKEMPARMEGLPAVVAKSKWWEANHTVHGFEVKGPWPHGDRFIVYFMMDVTPKAGPMAGKRFKMEETGLYTVKDGKVAQEEFFYAMG
ncbi:MAG TPA: nuclear transport factor 2 family protein [Tepidisphaeraceae bacterium]|nr:nuclear transport factor 2 family protein [Tepidisphaeraceae bacterium]